MSDGVGQHERGLSTKGRHGIKDKIVEIMYLVVVFLS